MEPMHSRVKPQHMTWLLTFSFVDSMQSSKVWSLIGGTMKYICFGYLDEKNWETMSESELNALVDECFAYDDLLRKNGHFVGSEALQPLGMPPHCDGRTA